MDLSLRTIAHNRYGLTGHFSVRNDVLNKLDSGVNYRTADRSVSLRLILTPPLKPKIVSFNAKASGPGEMNPVSFAWNVEPPTSWLKGNTSVKLCGKDSFNQIFWSIDVGKNGNGLIGMKNQSFTSTTHDTITFTFELSANVTVQGGMLDTTKDIPVEIVPPPPPPPPPQPEQAVTLNGGYTVGYISEIPFLFTLTLTGTLTSPQGPAVGQSTFSKTMNLTLPAQGSVLDLVQPTQTIQFTVSNLHAGTWNVTATSSLVSSSLQCSVNVPGYVSINANVPNMPTCL
jgi:hypothetical protein